jgi:hypothetical protein
VDRDAIFWTVVLATLSLQLFENWEMLYSNEVTLCTVMGFMMLALAAGLEIGATTAISCYGIR